MRSYTADLATRSIHKVAVYLQDDEIKGTVYVKIKGDARGRQVLEQSLQHAIDGEIYLDEACTLLVQDGYIELFNLPKRKNDFIFLIDRKYSENFIVGVEIIGNIPAE